jgi:TRAP-type C4-dicarboxylate transport system substrate-binding protein
MNHVPKDLLRGMFDAAVPAAQPEYCVPPSLLAAPPGRLVVTRHGYGVPCRRIEIVEGANAVPLPFPELYTALEQKAVDGQETALPTIETAKLDEVQKYLTTTHHVYDPLVVIFSRKTWDKRSEDERKILTEAAKEATPYLRELNRQREIQMIESVKAKGMTVTDMTKEERARMREHLKPVTEKYTREVGEDLAKEVHAEIDKARVSLAGK